MSATTLLVLLACLLIAAKFAGVGVWKIRAASCAGSTSYGRSGRSLCFRLGPPDPLVNSFANIGVILLMFVAGLETDMKQMSRVGGAAFISATAGVILPFIAGSAFAYALGYPLYVSLFLGTLLTATSVSNFRANAQGHGQAQ